MAFIPKPQNSSEPTSSSSEETVAITAPALTEEDTTIDVHDTRGAPIRYLPLDHLYSATSPCSGSSNVMSKKVKARKLPPPSSHFHQNDDVSVFHPNTNIKAANAAAAAATNPVALNSNKPPVIFVYSRRRRKRNSNSHSAAKSFYASLLGRVGCKDLEEGSAAKRRRIGTTELEKLGIDLGAMGSFDGPRLRECRNSCGGSGGVDGKGKGGSLENFPKLVSESRTAKRWVWLSFDNADPEAFIGLRCKVYWPMDVRWYSGNVKGYDVETKIHHVEYDDGDEENLILSNENVKFHVSREEMKRLKLSFGKVRDSNVSDFDVEEMLALAASLDDCQEFEPGDVLWAKLAVSAFEIMEKRGVLAKLDKRMAATARKKMQTQPSADPATQPSVQPSVQEIPPPVHSPPRKLSAAQEDKAKSVSSSGLRAPESKRPAKRARKAAPEAGEGSSTVRSIAENVDIIIHASKLVRRQLSQGLADAEERKLRAQVEEAANRGRMLEEEVARLKFALSKKDADLKYLDERRVEAESKTSAVQKELEEARGQAEKHRVALESSEKRSAEAVDKAREALEQQRSELEESAKANAELAVKLEAAGKANAELAAMLEAAEKETDEAWQSVQDGVDEAFEVVMAQVQHLAAGVDFSQVSVKNIFDPATNTIRPREDPPEGGV